MNLIVEKTRKNDVSNIHGYGNCNKQACRMGAGDVLDGCVCLRSCGSTGGFGPGGCWPDDFKKEGRCSDERKHVAQR